jgi:hypothetical protein
MTAPDVLAAIAFGAQRIVAAAGQHAGGAPFPDPNLIAAELTRMSELNEALKAMQQVPANEAAA